MSTAPPRPPVSPITTHVLDTARGAPAAGILVVLEHKQDDDTFYVIGEGTTNTDGRVTDLLPSSYALTPGIYRLTFETAAYFAALSADPAFYPEVSIQFSVAPYAADETQPPHYHVPLLLSPFGYTTYRGS